jgi:type IX secretion system PorP/SprF family membrane protein
MGIRKILSITLVLIGILGYGQQRAITSTYPYNLLILNPAYAGSLNVLSVIGVHRNQWINHPGSPETTSLSAHNSFAGNRIGVGIFAMNDRTGVTTDNSFYASYAYKISTKYGILAMGLQGGFNHRVSDFTQLELLDPQDPLLGQTVTRFTPNFGTGVYFANPNLYIGFSVPYILEPRLISVGEGAAITTTDARESRYYYFMSGVVLPITSGIKISPSILVRAQEENRIGYDITTNLIFDDIAYIGVNVRNSGEIVFLGQLILNENFRVGYAYDASVSSLAQSNAGSHEILLNYRIKLHNFKKDPLCPVYF